MIIFAPNHTNALCDAMAVLGIDARQKVFVARADIFRNPRIARVLHWLKIMPIRRIRDGIDEVRHNDETIENAVAVLHDRVPFCILPEGTHRPMHSLLPLSKGIFRIALLANERFGQDLPVYIVPVGLEYGDYYHLWDSLLIQIGQPISVTQMAADHLDLSQPQLINLMRDVLSERMRSLILWVPDDEHYDEAWSRLQASAPEPFRQMRPRAVPRSIRVPALVLTASLMLLAALVCWPLLLAQFVIRRRVEDAAFHNSLMYGVQLIFFTIHLLLPMPLWMLYQEWWFQYRQLIKK